jgi:hypothetical protein
MAWNVLRKHTARITHWETSDWAKDALPGYPKGGVVWACFDVNYVTSPPTTGSLELNPEYLKIQIKNFVASPTGNSSSSLGHWVHWSAHTYGMMREPIQGIGRCLLCDCRWLVRW